MPSKCFTNLQLMNEPACFGQLIHELRESKGISQERLSAISGLDRSFISMVERGKRNPTLVSIIKLSSALDVSLPDLFSQFELRLHQASDANGGRDAN